MEVNLQISEKQEEFLRVLEDKIHTEVFGGGAAGGQKSFTGCLWQVIRRIKYPGSRGFIARARLKSLKESTLLTFFEVCRLIGLKSDVDYKYNSQMGVIKFSNSSEIYLKDLFLYPSDPEFVSLGSTEYTDGFIDEMGDITEQAYQIIRSRVRFKLKEFNLIPKIFMASNPCKTFVYREFYKKFATNTLEPYKAYIPSRVYDNPFISEHYIENLKKLDKVNRERLLNGNWEYDDDPAKIFDYEKILDIFNNDFEIPTKHEKYISCDVARQGKDKTVLMVWSGLFIEKIITMDKSSTKQVRELIERASHVFKVPRSNIIVDEDGIGGGVLDETIGIKGFVAGRTPLNKANINQNYANLKTECTFKLAELVNKGMIGCYKDISSTDKGRIIDELEQIAQKDIDKDTQSIKLVGKEELKQNLGFSPDYSDTMMMRMFFELSPVLTAYVSTC